MECSEGVVVVVVQCVGVQCGVVVFVVETATKRSRFAHF